MTTTMIFLNEGQKMIYGRKRIMDTFYKVHPVGKEVLEDDCLLYTSPSPRDGRISRMPSSA